MLIEFQVENYRSFLSRQLFSMVAAKIPEHAETNTFQPSVKGVAPLVRTAMIYGHNAAGKTNLLRAIQFMKNFVLTSASNSAEYKHDPYKLSASALTEASSFQITFVQSGSRYEYGFSMGPKLIMDEWLVQWVHSGARTRARVLFERKWDGKKEKYIWKLPPFLKGQRTVWRDATRPDALFLSTAVQLNSDQLRPVLEWFLRKLHVIVGEITLNNSLTMKLLESKDGKGQILPFLKEADLGVNDLELERKTIEPGSMFNASLGPVYFEQKGSKADVTMPRLSHASDDEKVPVSFDFRDESSGTQIIFQTAGAWLNVLQNGEVLLFDEIDTNMHPALLLYLIRKFHSTRINPHNAQLVCSTHNTSLLHQSFFRRDQFWFVEKQASRGSQLYPLTDFRPRNDEVLDTWYMRGRYGAQPMLPGID